jgi:hypothetical protein
MIFPMEGQNNDNGAKLGVLERKLASLREVAGENLRLLDIVNDMSYHTRGYHQVYLLSAELIETKAEELIHNKLSRHEEMKAIRDIQDLSHTIINTIEEAVSYMEGKEQMNGVGKVTSDIMEQKTRE